VFRGRLPIYLLIGLVAAVALWGVTRGRQPAGEPGENRTQAARFTIPVANQVPPRGAVDYARLDERLQRLARDRSIVGFAVGIVENGEIRFLKGYGVTEAGGSEPVTPSTVFRWASLSKGVAADMVARLAADGSVSLDAPIAQYGTSLRLPNGNENVATVANLLSHTTGLFAHAEEPRLEEGMDPHLLRAGMAQFNASCTPGTCHAYQNVVYDAASEIVERVTGKPYGQVLQERLFGPLGMTTASTSRADLMASRSWARGHDGMPPRRFEINDIYYRVPAAGGVNGSIQDLAIWMLANMGLAPDVLTPAMLQQVQTPRIATPGENRRRARFSERTATTHYGLGWRVMDYAGHTVIGHHGGVKGFRSMIMFDPALKSGVVVLWNSASGLPNGIEYEVMDMVYHLPFRDWLFLESRQGAGRAPEPESEEGAASRERATPREEEKGRRRPGR
jgi:beta-lactamase class C